LHEVRESGKVMGIFELNVVCNWKGHKAGEAPEKGQLTIPELVTEDVDTNEYEIEVVAEASGEAAPATLATHPRRLCS